VTSERRHKRLIDMMLCPFGWLRPNEPLWRKWDRLPQAWREEMKELKSDDIRTANWHTRKRDDG
jgi:hypothetical protein